VIPTGAKRRFFNLSREETFEYLGKVLLVHDGFEKSVHIIYGLDEDGGRNAQRLPKSFVLLCLIADLGDERAGNICYIKSADSGCFFLSKMEQRGEEVAQEMPCLRK
jgi:hypothetical protein